VKTLAQKYYGGLKPSPGITKRHRPQEPVQRAPRRLTFSDSRVTQPYIVRSYLAPERNAGDQKQAAALSLLAQVLGGGGLTSVLGKNLQLEQKIALQATAFYDGLSLDPSTFGLVMVPVDGVSLQAGEDAMDAVIADFMKTGVDPDQLARIKAQIRASDIYARDNMPGLARSYGEALTSGLTVDDVDAWSGILQSVTADDIMAAAKMVFDPNYSVTGWLMRSNEEATQ
jgi:zinc protease